MSYTQLSKKKVKWKETGGPEPPESYNKWGLRVGKSYLHIVGKERERFKSGGGAFWKKAAVGQVLENEWALDKQR